MNNNLEYSQAMYNLNKTNLQLKSCQSLHPAQGCQQTVQCCQFHVWLRPSGYEHVADITQKQYKVYKNTFYIQWKVSAISLSNKSSWQTNAWRASSLSHDSGAGMALAGSRTRQMQRIPWKFDGISGTKCRSLAQYIRTRPTHHGISGGSFLALERVITLVTVGTGCVPTGLLLLVNWGDPGWWRHGIVCSLPHLIKVDWKTHLKRHRVDIEIKGSKAHNSF